MAQEEQKPTGEAMMAVKALRDAWLIDRTLSDSIYYHMAFIIDRCMRSREIFKAANSMLEALIDISRNGIPEGYTAQTWAAKVAEEAQPVMYPGKKP